ncbi:MAG TPA: CapA family protein [Candidatus Saccharimonadales bacterium]|nr:CapA family protein [Candidatus Saccharimonadales bacterium]
MLDVRPRRGNRRIIWWIVGVFAVLALAGGAWWWVDHDAQNKNQDTSSTPILQTKVPKPTVISSNTLMLGNTFWGRYINDWSMESPLKYEYPFSRLHEFQRETYDAWISGLECPTASGVHMTSAEMEVALQFNCSPEYLPEAAKWFTVFSLANNHTDNQGVEGFNETQALLDKHKIQYFGHYDPRALDDLCDVISLPVTVSLDNHDEKKGQLPVAMCGYHGVFRIPSDESLAIMEEYSKYMPVIAFPHMGVEYQPAPDQLKTSVYRSMIDHGADMVIGDHPHWIQNSESYKGHLIVYSMGNFIFDQQGSTELTRSAAIRVVMKSDSTDSQLMNKWLSIGKECASYHDDCLQKIISQDLAKLPMTYEFGVIGTDDSGKIVKPATSEQQASILQRLNWQATMDQLQAPYGSL